MITYEQFKKNRAEKYCNYDGQYGAQCWDLVAFFLEEVLGAPVRIISDYSNAIKNPNSEFFQYFDEVKTNLMQSGDVIIWTGSLHIAIFDHWNSQNQICYYFSQNPNPPRVIGIGGSIRAFRRKGYNPNPKPTPTPQPKPQPIEPTSKFNIGDKVYPIIKNNTLYDIQGTPLTVWHNEYIITAKTYTYSDYWKENRWFYRLSVGNEMFADLWEESIKKI